MLLNSRLLPVLLVTLVDVYIYQLIEKKNQIKFILYTHLSL